MNLHKDKDAFDIAIRSASRYYKLNPSIVEKDYYVTLVLKELTKQVPELLFKGGTSLSKCHKIIDRFSEDIDLTLDENSFSQSKRQSVKRAVVEACKTLGLTLLNEDETKSRRDYNCYKVDYSAQYTASEVKPQLLVETVFIVKSFPNELKSASCIIYDYLKEMGNDEAIAQFELYPFEVRVQTLDRTLVDKVFALCDYMLDQKKERQSRHIYDLYKLLSVVELNDRLKKLVKEVREERKAGAKCLSAQDEVDVQSLIVEMVQTEAYKKDYRENTSKLLFKSVSYEDAIASLERIIESGVFQD